MLVEGFIGEIKQVTKQAQLKTLRIQIAWSD